MTPDLNQLMELVNKVKGRQTTLDRVAGQQVANQPWRQAPQPGQQQPNAAQYAMGQGTTPAQGRGLNQLYGSILNRKPGQTSIGAASEGFERGSQLIDNIREKEKAGKVDAAKIGVDSSQQDFKNNAAMYGLGEKKRQFDEEMSYNKERDKVRQAQFDKELKMRGEDKVFASQVKEQAKVSNDLYSSETSATKAEFLANEMEEFAKTAPGGLRAQAETIFRNNTGLRGRVEVMRTKAAQVINTQVINNLPPGVASDRDIELARQGVANPATATVQELMEYMQAVSKIERGHAMYLSAKMEYMDNNNYSILGFQRQWDEKRKAMGTQEGVGSATPVSGPAQPNPGVDAILSEYGI